MWSVQAICIQPQYGQWYIPIGLPHRAMGSSGHLVMARKPYPPAADNDDGHDHARYEPGYLTTAQVKAHQTNPPDSARSSLSVKSA